MKLNCKLVNLNIRKILNMCSELVNFLWDVKEWVDMSERFIIEWGIGYNYVLWLRIKFVREYYEILVFRLVCVFWVEKVILFNMWKFWLFVLYCIVEWYMYNLFYIRGIKLRCLFFVVLRMVWMK